MLKDNGIIQDDTPIKEYLAQIDKLEIGNDDYFNPWITVGDYLDTRNKKFVSINVDSISINISVTMKLHVELEPDCECNHDEFWWTIINLWKNKEENGEDDDFEFYYCEDINYYHYDDNGKEVKKKIKTFGELKTIFNGIIKKYVEANEYSKLSKGDLMKEIGDLRQRITKLENHSFGNRYKYYTYD